MPHDGFSINLNDYFDMQHAGDSVALSPLPIARRLPSVCCQQDFAAEGYHYTEVEIPHGPSPMGLGNFGESDLTRWTRLHLVANLPWFRLIDLICTLLNDHSGGKAADNGFSATAVCKPEYSFGS